MLEPTFVGAENDTTEPGLPSPSTTPTISYFTTASASAGRQAPVMMRTHSPSPMVPSNTSPAPISAMTRSIAGLSSAASAISAARRAKPSMAECAKGDTSMSLVWSAATTRPTASSSSTVSTGNFSTAPHTSARASSNGIISLTGSVLPFHATTPPRCSNAADAESNRRRFIGIHYNYCRITTVEKSDVFTVAADAFPEKIRAIPTRRTACGSSGRRRHRGPAAPRGFPARAHGRPPPRR